MITWFKIGLRNLVKNRRRSAITALAIALGFAAVNLFGGFTEYMYTGNREVAIYGRAQGHITIFKQGFWEEGQLDPARYLLTPKEIKAAREICLKNPHVLLVSPQLKLSGLVTNGKVSTVFIGQGIVPSEADVFLSRTKLVKIREFEGKKLEDDKIYGVSMARGLAHLLDLKIGSDAVAFTTTASGQMNALDMEVFQLFDTDSAQMNDKAMRFPFSFAQALYDTDGADRLAVLLDKTEYTASVRNQLRAGFSERELALEVKTWNELSRWYIRVKEMFDVIFLVLFIIVFVIVVMSVINTMSMAVLERTREIGTLRALGLKRKGVILLFAVESSLLGILGTIVGLALTLLGWWWVDVFKPTWIPPGITKRVPIKIQLVPEFMLYSFLVLLILCLLSSFVPARRAARENVVDTLGHV